MVFKQLGINGIYNIISEVEGDSKGVIQYKLTILSAEAGIT